MQIKTKDNTYLVDFTEEGATISIVRDTIIEEDIAADLTEEEKSFIIERAKACDDIFDAIETRDLDEGVIYELKDVVDQIEDANCSNCDLARLEIYANELIEKE